MKRSSVRRTLIGGVALVVVMSLIVFAAGCSALVRGGRASSDTSVGQSPMPPTTTGEGTAGTGNTFGSDGKGAPATGDSSYYASPDEALSVVKPGANPAVDQLVIRNGSIRVRVKDVDATVSSIRSIIATFGGVIEDLQISTETDQPVYRTLASGETMDVVPLGAYVTIRVPGDKLDALTKKIGALGTVLRQWSNQTDVTQQHIDLTARLKNLRAEEARLRDFLKAAKDVKEMLLVETELSRVRGEIESQQAQLDYLDRQIAYATLSVELQKPAPVVRPTTGTDWGFGDAITRGVQGAVSALQSIITIAIAILPLLVIALVAFLIIRLIVRRGRRHPQGADAGSEGDDLDVMQDEAEREDITIDNET